MPEKKRTTLRDVALAAGVSTMSVSKALNNKSGLSPKTRAHILKVAAQLNYQPNLVAKSLRLDETKTLGVVVSDSSEMVVSKVLRGIADYAEAQDYNIIISNTDSDREKERRAVKMLMSKCIDGLLLVASTLTSEQDSAWLKSLRIPVILLMRVSRHALDSVVNNNFEGAYQITCHMIQQGCKTFCFLPLTSISQSGHDRMEGSRRALEEHGIPFFEENVVHTRPSIRAGYESMCQLLERNMPFDALVCGCDLIAIGALEALRGTKIRVPQQLRICGYDDIELAGFLRVPLTTMRQPLYDIGKKGVQLLLERIQNRNMPVQRIVLDSTLIVRESTGGPAQPPSELL